MDYRAPQGQLYSPLFNSSLIGHNGLLVVPDWNRHLRNSRNDGILEGMMSNLPLVLGPLLAMLTTPRLLCFNVSLISSANLPLAVLKMLLPPLPVPVKMVPLNHIHCFSNIGSSAKIDMWEAVNSISLKAKSRSNISCMMAIGALRDHFKYLWGRRLES